MQQLFSRHREGDVDADRVQVAVLDEDMLTRTFKPDAILWDFDGTLADSAARNIAITRQILARVAPRPTGLTHSGANPQQWRVQPDEVIDKPAALTALVTD